MTSWYDPRSVQRPPFRFSLLNLKVDALYAICSEEMEGCMPGRVVYSGGYFIAPCVRCGVPEEWTNGVAWRDNSTMFRNGEAA